MRRFNTKSEFLVVGAYSIFGARDYMFLGFRSDSGGSQPSLTSFDRVPLGLNTILTNKCSEVPKFGEIVCHHCAGFQAGYIMLLHPCHSQISEVIQPNMCCVHLVQLLKNGWLLPLFVFREFPDVAFSSIFAICSIIDFVMARNFTKCKHIYQVPPKNCKSTTIAWYNTFFIHFDGYLEGLGMPCLRGCRYPFSCACGRGFVTAEDLQRHVNGAHGGQTPVSRRERRVLKK
jgi:hypothetical protein